MQVSKLDIIRYLAHIYLNAVCQGVSVYYCVCVCELRILNSAYFCKIQ